MLGCVSVCSICFCDEMRYPLVAWFVGCLVGLRIVCLCGCSGVWVFVCLFGWLIASWLVGVLDGLWFGWFVCRSVWFVGVLVCVLVR